MRSIICLLILVHGTIVFATPVSYSFLKKARSHYKNEIEKSPEFTKDNAAIDSALNTFSDSSDFRKAYNISWQISLFLLEHGRHALALDIFNDIRQILEAKAHKSNEDLKKISSVYNVIGAIYEETGLWNDALSMYMNSLQACDKTDNEAGKAKVYNNIGKLYFNRNVFDKAESLFNKAIIINKKLDIRPELFNNYNNIAGIYHLRHNPNKALEYALIALNQLDINRDFYNVSIAYSNIGNLYQDLGNKTVALSYYEEAAKIQERNSFQVALLRSYISISSLYQEINKLDSATSYINKSLKLVKNLRNPSQNLFIYKTAARYFNMIGNYKSANDLYSRYITLNDSLETLNSITKIEQIQAVNEVINKEKDNKILQQKINLKDLAIQRQQIILFAAAVIFLFVISLLFNGIRNTRRERKRNSLIMKQSDLLHQQEKQILIDKERNLTLELDYKNRQLTSYALHLVRNNEFVQKSTEELKHLLLELNPRDKERSDRIKQMISDLHQYSSGNVWEEFRLYFEEVHQSFDKNLSSAFPSLSPNDKKVCALLKLGLSTKEIASITFRELRSVESARNRLRKKLGLDPDVNIQIFLSQF
ncbi:MAG: tetratricopeptide repeat protein [Bacteroidetes bacterium]|nr:tetratricopeptide repeat protein [Bacteroidota bacterium]